LALLVKKTKMATLKQIEANRRNALKSTGPRTLQGKAVVSLNSLRHGLRARTVVLPGESLHEFYELCDDLEAEWQPQTPTEQFYLEQMAVSRWKLNRMEVGEVDIFGQVATGKNQLPLLDRLWQAQSRMERSHARAQHELEHLQSERVRQDQSQAEPALLPAEEIPSATAASSIPAPHPDRTAPDRVCATVPAPADPQVGTAVWPRDTSRPNALDYEVTRQMRFAE